MEKPISSRIKRTQCDYTLAFKSQIVAAIEKGDMTYKQAQITYGYSLRKQLQEAGIDIDEGTFVGLLINVY